MGVPSGRPPLVLLGEKSFILMAIVMIILLGGAACIVALPPSLKTFIILHAGMLASNKATSERRLTTAVILP